MYGKEASFGVHHGKDLVFLTTFFNGRYARDITDEKSVFREYHECLRMKQEIKNTTRPSLQNTPSRLSINR